MTRDFLSCNSKSKLNGFSKKGRTSLLFSDLDRAITVVQREEDEATGNFQLPRQIASSSVSGNVKSLAGLVRARVVI